MKTIIKFGAFDKVRAGDVASADIERDGQLVGCVERYVDDANYGTSIRGVKPIVSDYEVSLWSDAGDEGLSRFFVVRDYGDARKALAAAKEWARAELSK